MRGWSARLSGLAAIGRAARSHGVSEFRIFRVLRLFRMEAILYLTQVVRTGETR